MKHMKLAKQLAVHRVSRFYAELTNPDEVFCNQSWALAKRFAHESFEEEKELFGKEVNTPKHYTKEYYDEIFKEIKKLKP